jgi:hypothetical protein
VWYIAFLPQKEGKAFTAKALQLEMKAMIRLD